MIPRIIIPGKLDGSDWTQLPMMRCENPNLDRWKVQDFIDKNKMALALLRPDSDSLVLMHPAALDACRIEPFIHRGEFLCNNPAWNGSFVYVSRRKINTYIEHMAQPCRHPMITRDFTPAAKNKGGRPPKADWEAYREEFFRKVASDGRPDRLNVDGWQGNKDVARWVETLIDRESIAEDDRPSTRSIQAHVTKWMAETPTE